MFSVCWSRACACLNQNSCLIILWQSCESQVRCIFLLVQCCRQHTRNLYKHHPFHKSVATLGPTLTLVCLLQYYIPFIYTQLKTLIWPFCADVSLNSIYLSIFSTMDCASYRHYTEKLEVCPSILTLVKRPNWISINYEFTFIM